jgi:hypothetical protein
MGGFEPVGRTLIAVGAIIVLVGLALAFGDRIPFLGRLPGDIRIERPGFTFFAPIGTMLVVSLLASLVIALLGRR